MPGRQKRMRYTFANEAFRQARSAQQPVYAWRKVWASPAKSATSEDNAVASPYKVFKWEKTGQTVVHEDDEEESVPQQQVQVIEEPDNGEEDGVVMKETADVPADALEAAVAAVEDVAAAIYSSTSVDNIDAIAGVLESETGEAMPEVGSVQPDESVDVEKGDAPMQVDTEDVAEVITEINTGDVADAITEVSTEVIAETSPEVTSGINPEVAPEITTELDVTQVTEAHVVDTQTSAVDARLDAVAELLLPRRPLLTHFSPQEIRPIQKRPPL
ncbi:hypothetical protein BX661DRAFT_38745 [Kickxella alabastrina]|uniref:uncharacterized protein n=1 Tax=Kickxella alabastrina TaxID=61397 RepID=UPI00222127D9|nr:uncharacterized protein BX661DRAFT_38745 [Kickxella alabastrina]KAI7825473.1 hypothetical protein BX661DRAFT_38745 [Kickxella alabastrina]